jgi:predicted GNAT superfamily acetyltransferase
LADKVHIRKLREFSEFEELIHIQKAVWKHDDVDATPVHQFCVHARMGAILLGAFVEGRMAGFVYSFPALRDKVLFQHSHLLAVLPEFQGLGIGKSLKWAQRKEALKQGIGLITWTYDPLLAKNANLNLHALGVRSRTYFSDFYGSTPSLCLAQGVPTDRLLVEWRIGDQRILDRRKAGARAGRPDVDRIPKALERLSGTRGLLPLPGPAKLGFRAPVVLVEIPPDINAMRSHPETIRAWQSGLRTVMSSYFRRGYSAADFLFGDRCYYVLTK